MVNGYASSYENSVQNQSLHKKAKQNQNKQYPKETKQPTNQSQQ